MGGGGGEKLPSIGGIQSFHGLKLYIFVKYINWCTSYSLYKKIPHELDLLLLVMAIEVVFLVVVGLAGRMVQVVCIWSETHHMLNNR